MVRMHGPRDVILEYESRRLLDVSFLSSSSSYSGNLLEGDSKLPPESSTKSDLARVAPLTFVAIARMRATKVEAVERATQEESSATCSEEAVTHRGCCNLDYNVSKVT